MGFDLERCFSLIEKTKTKHTAFLQKKELYLKASLLKEHLFYNNNNLTPLNP